MSIEPGQIIVWIIIGALAGAIASTLYTRSRAGYGTWLNVAFGLVGALLGGFLFRLLGINITFLETMTFSFQDLLAAIIGALIIIVAYNLFLNRQSNAPADRR